MDADENDTGNRPKTEEENDKNILLNNEKCDQCGMLFTSSESLRVHKEKFCVGVVDSGNNRTNSPPINSKYIQNLKNSDDFNNDDLDDLNDEMSIMEKSLQNESLNDLDREFNDPEPVVSKNNKITPRDNNSLLDKNTPRDKITPRNRVKTPSVIDEQDDYIPKEKLTSRSRIKSPSVREEQDEYLPKEKVTARSKIKSPPIIDEQDDFISNAVSRNKSKNQSKFDDNYDYNGNASPRSNKVSIYSNNRFVATPSNHNDVLKSTTSLQNPAKTAAVIHDVKQFKSKKSVEQSLQDLEDTLVRDTIRDKKLVNSLNKNPSIGSNLDTKFDVNNDLDDDPYKKLLKEYGDLKKKEKDILKEVYDYNPDFKTYSALHFEKDNEFLKNDFLSLFEDFDDIDLELLETLSLSSFGYKPKMNDETRINLMRIQEKTEQLERERRDIQFKIEALKNNTSYAAPMRSSPSVNRLLSELKNQQTLNEAALTLLRDRLVSEPPLTTTNIIPLRSGVLPPIYSTTTNKPVINPMLLNALNSGNDLSPEEIRVMRLNYLQSGGHDHSVLNRFTDLEYNARYPSRSVRPVYSTTYNPNAADLENRIQKIDIENKRIQAELELLQNKISYSSPPYYDGNRRFQNINLPPIQVPQSQPTNNNQYLNGNSGNFYTNTQTNRNFYTNQDQYTQRSLNQPTARPQSNQQSYQNQSLIKLKDLPPAVYDPNGGFVLFIDYVTNIEPNYASARVITCLHHPKSGLGEPSVLPIVNTETFAEKNYQNTVALISTKQPVPRCPPQQALTILIELQMALKDNNETRLKSCAWTKIPLFDSKNRLLSGRWRCSLKNLPIKSETTINNLDSVPEYGNTELFYRLVNLRDSDEQTNAPISPAYADQYNPTAQENYENDLNEVPIKLDDSFEETKITNIKSKANNKKNQPNPNDHLLENHKDTKSENKNTKKLPAIRKSFSNAADNVNRFEKANNYGYSKKLIDSSQKNQSKFSTKKNKS